MFASVLSEHVFSTTVPETFSRTREVVCHQMMQKNYW